MFYRKTDPNNLQVHVNSSAVAKGQPSKRQLGNIEITVVELTNGVEIEEFYKNYERKGFLRISAPSVR
jgi:hypothetical protein